MSEEASRRRLHASLFRRRRSATSQLFLSDDDFRFAAECERMRVDRNGSTLAVLIITLAEDPSEEHGLGFLERVLEGRLRVTDTIGVLNDGRVGVLLPDTSSEGAWKVATDISEVYPPGPGRPKCDVVDYPDRSGKKMLAPNGGQGVAQELDSSGSSSRTEDQGELFFARAMPWWKRSIDLLGSLAGLLVSSPIVLGAAIAIKLTSHGPVFFTQEREGHGGRRFRMWKLRTMVVDAEHRQTSLREHNHQDGPAFKMRSDPRRTTVGKFLRWTSIDELPQLWNVLRGEMSLVGPRPLPTHESRACENWQRRRLGVVPGMTCLWQIGERGHIRFEDWMRMDLQYADHVRWIEDLRLLAVTLPSLIFQKGIR